MTNYIKVLIEDVALSICPHNIDTSQRIDLKNRLATLIEAVMEEVKEQINQSNK